MQKATLLIALLALGLMVTPTVNGWGRQRSSSRRRTATRDSRERSRERSNGQAKTRVVQAFQGAADMYRAYEELKENPHIPGADKYFHAKGNYNAAQRGPGGKWAAEKISNARERYQNQLSGQTDEDTQADQEANRHGRNGGDPNDYRPEGLPTKY